MFRGRQRGAEICDRARPKVPRAIPTNRAIALARDQSVHSNRCARTRLLRRQTAHLAERPTKARPGLSKMSARNLRFWMSGPPHRRSVLSWLCDTKVDHCERANRLPAGRIGVARLSHNSLGKKTAAQHLRSGRGDSHARTHGLRRCRPNHPFQDRSNSDDWGQSSLP